MYIVSWFLYGYKPLMKIGRGRIRKRRRIVMRSTKATRWLSGTLAALLLAQGMCLPAGAWSWGNWGSSSQVETLETKATAQLQNGTAIIPADADEAAVKQVLFDALVIIAIFKIKAYENCKCKLDTCTVEIS